MWNIGPGDSDKGYTSWFDISYQDHFTKYIKNLIEDKPKRRFIDIGSHLGYITIPLSKYYHTVESFEICYDNFKYLNKNISESGQNNINSYNIGLSNIQKDDVGIVFDSKNTGTTHIVGYGITEREDNPTHFSKLTTLDSFNFSDVDFIKIDVEGHELEVLEGCIETIIKCKPLIIFEMFYYRSKINDKKRKYIFDLLKNWMEYEFIDLRKNDFVFGPRSLL